MRFEKREQQVPSSEPKSRPLLTKLPALNSINLAHGWYLNKKSFNLKNQGGTIYDVHERRKTTVAVKFVFKKIVTCGV